MQLITLTAPDGHRERWQPSLTVKALKLLYKYLNNPDQDKINPLASEIKVFVGDDIQQVHAFLVYAQAVQDNLFSKLDIISNDGKKSMVKVYFLLRSLETNSTAKKGIANRKTADNNTISIIEQVTDND